MVERAVMTRFMRERGHGSYDELWRWSVEDLEGFWASIWDFFGVEGGYDRVLASSEMPGAEWFPGARVNYAEHLFRGKDDGAVAIVHASELRELGRVDVGRAARADGEHGRAACARSASRRATAWPPTCRTSPRRWPRFLATASIGAVWSSCSPDFGARSVIDRFAQIEPKVLLAVDGYRYNGRDFDRRETVEGIAAEVGGQVLTLGYLDGTGWPDDPGGDLDVRARAVRPPAVGPVLLRDDRACRRRSSRARAGSCSSTSRSSTCTSTRRPATACSGSRRPAG